MTKGQLEVDVINGEGLQLDQEICLGKQTR